ncbi:hypothetical protein PHMEG_00032386 [Phytophthora megakarya]|uniref:Retrotransposon gag domain-containing protein n=1 Tax=Phytophthora megakarya TaxID=4795 RepID=A0A225UWI5_9STRA|nr:hypothetical protein PHMEG_00032386 [Phytophthora megakarya]
MKIRQLRSRMPTAIRDWFMQLPKSTRHDWKQMSRRFRKLYNGTRGSYSERYFTMKMTDHETPLQFFYRLNAAAVKAEVRFKSSSKLRESHIRSFIKKLRNDQLKTALEGHRFQSITDLEHALRRHEDVWCEEGYDSPTLKKPRDFRADNVHQGQTQNRGPTRRQGPAFVTQGDAEPPQDAEFQHESQNPEVVAEQAEALSKSISDIRVAENQHWKSPNPHQGQGVARPEKWDVYCEKCKKWGHPEVNCWTGMICERYQAKGHPARVCTRIPCAECGGFHGGISCEQWKAFQSVMTLAKQGNASELPTQFRSLLQTKDHASGAQQLNQ